MSYTPDKLRAQQAFLIEMVKSCCLQTEARGLRSADVARRTVERFDSEPIYLFTLLRGRRSVR
jgi:hypothetical protein